MFKNKAIWMIICLSSLIALPVSNSLAFLPKLGEYPLPPLAKIHLQLSDEAWVSTTTARVHVKVAATHQRGELSRVRQQILAKLAELAPQVDWHVTHFFLSQDQSGLETVQLQAQARLEQKQIGHLRSNAKKLSRPGLNMQIQDVSFDASLSDQEATRAQLRSTIYQRAKEELAKINALYPQHTFVLGEINFINNLTPIRRELHTATMKVAESSAPVVVSQKISQLATVTLQEQAAKQ